MRFLVQTAISIALCWATAAVATPLRLDYSVTAIGGGLFNYEFALVLDNHDNSFVQGQGQGWGWVVFGDSPINGGSPLADFIGDPNDLPIGPWTGYSDSGGAHNGPTLNPSTTLWFPSAVGETLTWSGTSATDLAQGSLLFSTVLFVNGVTANFEIANRIDVAQLPEPRGLALVAVALLALGLTRLWPRGPRAG